MFEKSRYLLSFLAVMFIAAGCEDTTVYVSPGSDGSGTCSNACDLGDRECTGKAGYKKCIENANGCLVWKKYTCADTKVCSGGKCVAEDDQKTCVNECDQENLTECDEDAVKTCVYHKNGCLEWSDIVACQSGTCHDGRCTGCEDECTANKAECVDNALRTCKDENGDGCLEWSSPIECLSGTCEADHCGGCDNVCNPDDRDCSQDDVVICQIQADGCYGWSEPTACENGCSNGECQCHNDCEKIGDSTCVGDNAYKTCESDAKGCLKWSEEKACAEGCAGGECKSCNHACEANARECNGEGYRVCEADANGCRRWSDVTKCDAGCEGGNCKAVCHHACNENAKECSGNGFRTCKTDANGCRIWSAVTPCDNGCASGACVTALNEPTRYPGNRILSPITAYSVKKMKDIAAKNSSRNNASFMKMGDSHMYKDASFMYCFSTKNAKHSGYNLNGLKFDEVAAYFQSSFDSFGRVSVLTVSGETINLVLKNNKANLTTELGATNPRFAFFGFGSNDMGWYDYTKHQRGAQAGYFTAMEWYFRNYISSMDALIKNGVIPMLIGTGWRTDTVKYYGTSTVAAAQDQPRHFVTTFSAVARGIAEYYQIPYYDLQLSHTKIPGYGLSGDGLHHQTKNNGCDFTTAGLNAGANMRNRYAIEMLDRAWRAVIKGETAPDQVTPFKGKGTKAAPYEITDLPYTHMTSSKGGEKNFGVYSCASTKEMGPERIYKLTVANTTKVRAFAMSAAGVDVDIHILKALDANQCMARGNHWVEASLSAGTYYFVVDTCNGSGDDTNGGLYLFGIHPCDSDDAACGSKADGG